MAGYNLTIPLGSGVLIGQTLNASPPMDGIKCVTIGNSSNCTVALWFSGVIVPSAPPDIMVPSGAYQTIPVSVARALSINFMAPLGVVAAGSVYVHVSDETLSASGFQTSPSNIVGAWDSSNWDQFNWG